MAKYSLTESLWSLLARYVNTESKDNSVKVITHNDSPTTAAEYLEMSWNLRQWQIGSIENPSVPLSVGDPAVAVNWHEGPV